MGSDDHRGTSGDAPRPSRQPGELPQLRIFRFRGGKPSESPPGSPAAPETDLGHAPADTDTPDILDDSTGTTDSTRAQPDDGSGRTGGTRPIRLAPPPAAPMWDATTASGAAATPPGPPRPPASPPPSAPRRRGRLPLVVGGGAIVVVLAILGWFLVGGFSDDDAQTTDTANPAGNTEAGGANGEPMDAADWSQRACAAVNTWNAETGELPPTLDGLVDQGGADVSDTLVVGYETLTDAAQTLSSALTALGAPEVEGGRSAADDLDTMAEQVIEDVTQGRSDAAQVDDGEGPLSGPPPQELVTELTGIVDTPGDTLREIIVNTPPPLQGTFAATPECADYV